MHFLLYLWILKEHLAFHSTYKKHIPLEEVVALFFQHILFNTCFKALRSDESQLTARKHTAAAQKAPLLLWCIFANEQHKRFLGICSNKYNIQQISEMALHYIVGVARNCARTVSKATTTTPATASAHRAEDTQATTVSLEARANSIGAGQRQRIQF